MSTVRNSTHERILENHSLVDGKCGGSNVLLIPPVAASTRLGQPNLLLVDVLHRSCLPECTVSDERWRGLTHRVRYELGRCRGGPDGTRATDRGACAWRGHHRRPGRVSRGGADRSERSTGQTRAQSERHAESSSTRHRPEPTRFRVSRTLVASGQDALRRRGQCGQGDFRTQSLGASEAHPRSLCGCFDRRTTRWRAATYMGSDTTRRPAYTTTL